ncbi:MAG: hypothetical protein MHM6MM_006231 [Cercozoa sp. M6MM]
MTPEQLMNADADSLGNDQAVEVQWAARAFKHAETYHRLLKMMMKKDKCASMRLTSVDDELYEAFRSTFPQMDVARINEDNMKNKKNKRKWHNFILNWQFKVQDYHMGTLVRVDVSRPFGESNSALVSRVQFYCIELARNREGINMSGSEPLQASS